MNLNRLALRLKVNKIGGGPIHHVAILKRILDKQNIRSEMIKGYCIITETKEACEHYWVRTAEGLDLDIVFAVAKLKSPELEALSPVLLETLPSWVIRSDENELRIREENERLFLLYQQDSKAFWREAPKDVANFHLSGTFP